MLGIGKGNPVEPITRVMLGLLETVKLGADRGSPVEPMILVILTELKGGVEGIDVRFKTDGVRTIPVDRMMDEKLVRFASVGNVGDPETEVEMFNEVGIERLGTETLGVRILEIAVERLNERVAETFPPIETEKPELGRVGVGRGIELLRESDVVEIEMVLASVGIVKDELTTPELLGMEGIDMKVEGIENVPTAISVVTPDKRVLLYSMTVWRALAVRVRVCIRILAKIFGFAGMRLIYRFWNGEYLNSLSFQI